MAVFLLKAKNGSAFIPPAATGTIFADVHTGDFAADWIEEAYHEGIMFGGNSSPTYELCTTGNFCPNVNVVRGPMAPFLVRAFGL